VEILLASHNSAKIRRYRALLTTIPGLCVYSLAERGITFKVAEPFASALKNAQHKAQTYAQLSGMVTIAVDEAVTTDFLGEAEQPGVFVRREGPAGHDRSDVEVLEYWKALLSRYPQAEKHFFWNYSIAFYDPLSGLMRAAQVTAQSRVVPFSPVLTPGYPMSSFLAAEGSDQPFAELSCAERHQLELKIFAPFLAECKRWLDEVGFPAALGM
jgi:hypothetical protein